MRHWLILCGVLVLSTTVYADIYKWVDEKGVVHYSDTPKPGSTPVVLPSPQSYQSDPNLKSAMGDQPQSGTPATPTRQYQSLKIVKPQPEETVRNNSGDVEVVVSSEPPLQAGDKLVVLLDGKAAGEPQAGTSMTLQNVDRGTHQLQIHVVDMQGKTLNTSDPVTFFMHRAIMQPPPVVKPVPAGAQGTGATNTSTPSQPTQ